MKKKIDIAQMVAENTKIHENKNSNLTPLYTIKDTLVGFINAPFPSENDETAKRLFVSLAKESQDNLVNTFPENKELWRVGYIDKNTGNLISAVQFLDRASAYQRNTPSPQPFDPRQMMMRQRLAMEQQKENELKETK